MSKTSAWEEQFEMEFSELWDKDESLEQTSSHEKVKAFIARERELVKKEVVEFLKNRGEQAVRDLWYVHRSDFEAALEGTNGEV